MESDCKIHAFLCILKFFYDHNSFSTAKSKNFIKLVICQEYKELIPESIKFLVEIKKMVIYI